jgi:hypothetical protein
MKYLIDINNGETVILFTYNQQGMLTGFSLEKHHGDTSDNTKLTWIHKNMPFLVTGLDQWRQKIKNIRISQPVADTSFQVFWNSYGYKVGNKKRAERLWNVLTEEERLAALSAVGRYDRYLAERTRMEKAYPETWLAQRRWESVYNL